MPKKLWGWPWATMPKGKCYGCGKELLVTLLGKHIVKCKALHTTNTIPLAEIIIDATLSDRLVTIAVICKPHFILLQARGDATIKDLNNMIVKLWMESECGHLSSFSLNGKEYLPLRFGDANDDRAVRLGTLQVGEGEYVFDQSPHNFNVIANEKVEGGQVPASKITLVGRNLWPDFFNCHECKEKKATVWVDDDQHGYCTPCLNELVLEDPLPEGEEELAGALEWPSLLEKQDKRTGESVCLFRMFNSPRVGCCGFDGSEADYQAQEAAAAAAAAAGAGGGGAAGAAN